MYITIFSFVILPLFCGFLHAATTQGDPPLTAEEAATAYPSLNASNTFGTYLWGFKGCDSSQRKAIYQAYDDFRTLTNQDGVREKIDFDSAAALEYLGPSGFNLKAQPGIQAVFANAATVYPGSFNPFQWYIVVRCDDPFKRCHNDDDDKDPCNPNPGPNPPQPKPATSSLNAYSKNKDPDHPNGSGMINFCKRYFKKPSLETAIRTGRNLGNNDHLYLASYLNQAETMFHEMMHLDHVANSGEGNLNPVIEDLSIEYTLRRKNGPSFTDQSRAYGPTRAKLMARFEPKGTDSPTGYYIQRNAENFVLYALAMYVQSRIGGYPHRPVITNLELTRPPWKERNALIEFTTDGTQTLLIDSGLGDDNIDREPISACSDKSDGLDPIKVDSDSLFTLVKPFNNSMYPPSYMAQHYQWLSLEGYNIPAHGQFQTPRCNSEGLTTNKRSVTRAEAADKIITFCSNKRWWDTDIVPAIAFGTGQDHKALGVSDNFSVNDGKDKVFLDVSFQPGCKGHSLFAIGTNDDDKIQQCKTRFLTVLDSCDLGTQDQKWGGGLVDGCKAYRIGAVPKEAADPFPVFTGGPQLSCSDADASFNPSWAKACQCFFTGEPETTALFDKPSGGCGSIKKPPANMFAG